MSFPNTGFWGYNLQWTICNLYSTVLIKPLKLCMMSYFSYDLYFTQKMWIIPLFSKHGFFFMKENLRRHHFLKSHLHIINTSCYKSVELYFVYCTEQLCYICDFWLYWALAHIWHNWWCTISIIPFSKCTHTQALLTSITSWNNG
jgi:hypothetical protein